ncbi:MAG: hypothetical protein ACYDH6_20955 [Acidimicrobiales bacterium]
MDRWWFEFAGEGGSYGGYASLEYRRQERVAWWSAAFVGAGWPLVAIRAHDVRIPTTGTEIRTDGLWASITEDTVMMEAFGAVFEDPYEAWGEERGDIVPFGFDLEWSSGEVHGEVLLGDDRIEVDGSGSRTPTYGLTPDTHVVHVSPVKPNTIHALCRVGDDWRWVSWDEDRTSPSPRPPG